MKLKPDPSETVCSSKQHCQTRRSVFQSPISGRFQSCLSILKTLSLITPRLYLSQNSFSIMALYFCSSSCTFFGNSPPSSRIFPSTSVRSPLCHQAILVPRDLLLFSLETSNCFPFLLGLCHFPAPQTFSSFVHVHSDFLILVYICEQVCVPADILNILITCDTKSESRHLQRRYHQFMSSPCGFFFAPIHFGPCKSQRCSCSHFSPYISYTCSSCSRHIQADAYFVLSFFFPRRSTFLSVAA